MTRVFDFLYGNPKSKKYTIFALICVYCSMTLFKSTSLFLPENTSAEVLSKVFKILSLVLLSIIVLYLFADILTGKIKIGWKFIILSVFFATTFLISGNGQLLAILVFIYLLSQYDFNEFFKILFYSILTVFSLIIICSFIGLIPDIIGVRVDNIRHTLGFDCSTITQSIFMFLILASVVYYRTRLSWLTLFLEAGVATAIFILTDSRAGYYLSIFILLIVACAKIYPLFKNKLKPIKVSNKLTKCLCVLLCITPVLTIVLFTVLVIIWPSQSEFIQMINTKLSGRLNLAYVAYRDYGLSLFGLHSVDLEAMANAGISVDNSYYHALFAYGIVNTLVILAFNIFAIYYSLKKKNYWLTFALMVIVADAFIEPCLVAYQYNLIVFALMAMFDFKTILLKERLKIWGNEKKMIIKDKKITAVVVTYNRKELLKECVQALQNQTYKNLNILIVDNASTDGTKEYVENLLNDKTEYVNTGANLGGAGGFNFGIAKAVEDDADFVWIMDDDCIPNNDALQKLVEFGEEKQEEFGFLSSKVLWKDNSMCEMNIQRTGLGQAITDFENPQKIKLASFVSILLNTNCIEKLGLPIKEFFIWGDDWEYTARISELYNCFYVPNSVVIHKSKNNMGVDLARDENERFDRYFYAYRNEGFFYAKQGFSGKLYFFIKKQYHKIKILFSKTKNKKDKFSIMKKGCKAVKGFNPKIEYAYRKSTQVNVLECFAEPLAYGGQEAFIINMYKNFSASNIKYTFFTPFNLTNEKLINLAKERNEEILHADKKFESKFRKCYIKSSYVKLFKEHSFDVVHIHSGSVWALFTISKLAKRYGVKKVIIHSHSCGTNTFMYRLVKKLSDRKIEIYVDNFCACSNLAAEWKFPKSVIESKNYNIVNNGIDIKNFVFDEKKREEYRKEFNLGNSLVLCNVGRISVEKNQNFSIEVAQKLNEQNVDFKFFFVGEGDQKPMIIDKINKLGLQDKFILLEKRNDVAQIMMASDIFVLPSLYEGFPVVGIEAQATGLPTLCSDTITEEVLITDSCKLVPLEVDAWVQAIMECQTNGDRAKYAQIVSKAGYNAKQSAEFLEKLYLER